MQVQDFVLLYTHCLMLKLLPCTMTSIKILEEFFYPI